MVLPQSQYTGGEVATMENNPSCLPSCLAAYIKYFQGGNPHNCNQNLCIVDNVATNGVDVTIINVCPICNTISPHPQCICFIHVNDVTVSGQDACNSIIHVNAQGQIVSTEDNSGQVKDQTLTGAIMIVLAVGVLVGALILYGIIILVRRIRQAKKNE
jgi:hypothetical protein